MSLFRGYPWGVRPTACNVLCQRLGAHADMDCWGAGVRWDVGNTERLEGYERLRGETDTRDSILALTTPG